MECSETATDEGLSVLKRTSVLAAEPLYTRVQDKTGEERVSGVKLTIRGPEGVSADRLERILQCHSARALLGQLDPSSVSHDPYVLPGEWLEIRVVPEHGNYTVSLSADTVSKNLQVLDRVSAYAASHGA